MKYPKLQRIEIHALGKPRQAAHHVDQRGLRKGAPQRTKTAQAAAQVQRTTTKQGSPPKTGEYKEPKMFLTATKRKILWTTR